MSDPYIGEVRLFGGNYAPRGWAVCDGTLLPIAEFDALFSLIGTIYGGDGQTTFALPDLRSRVVVGQGQGPGLSGYTIGDTGGSETVTLTLANLPAHAHGLRGVVGSGSTSSPTGNSPARGGSYSSTPDLPMAPTAAAGGNQPHNNVMPVLGVSFIIALEGIYPSQS